MKKEKVNLKKLAVQSFITSVNNDLQQNLLGGSVPSAPPACISVGTVCLPTGPQFCPAPTGVSPLC